MRKGFTLIELLAVIVILAIIALIATPIILGIINNSKEESYKRSIEVYAKALENAIVDYQLKNNRVPESISELKIEYEGASVNCQLEGINVDGSIYLSDCKVNGENVNYSYGMYIDSTGANSPKLQGLVPVKYDGENWRIVSTKDKWYDYDKQEWANAVILNEGVSNEAGTLIYPDGENVNIKGMFVWIPRYSYTIKQPYGVQLDEALEPSLATPGSIDIKFVYVNTKEEGNATYIGDEPSEWRTHPAFTFGTEELTGIWVGKFETSHTTLGKGRANNDLACASELENCENADGLRILPNVQSLRYNNISNMFYAARSMTRNGNSFGLDKEKVDTHMMKNSEWGAVAYLSQSKYGKYGNNKTDVYVNNCRTYNTGVAGNSSSEKASSETCDTNTYNTQAGQEASTTGNIYGIYDMSGGAWEEVMGVLLDSNGNPYSGKSKTENSGFNGNLQDGTMYTDGVDFPDSKYYDSYTNTTVAHGCDNEICYGQALSETQNWYGNYAYFVALGNTWLLRGGGANYGSTNFGIFTFMARDGGFYSDRSFRIVIS